MKERLQKLMARADLGSRRASEQMIRDARVTVNGRIAALGDQADPAVDDVRVDGQRLKTTQYRPRYYVFNKPTNVLSVNSAPPGDERQTVRELIPVEGHLFVIGRLDAESEGLMVLTNDGDIAHKLAHPSFEHTKTYKVSVYGHPTEHALQQWEDGVWIDDKRSARCYISILEKTPKITTLRIVMTEGRKRQIRRIASQLGYPVNRLVRTHIGQLGLGTLPRGNWYELSEEEVAAMLMPAEEGKLIKAARRRFRAKEIDKETPTSENTRHRVPMLGDRSQSPRVMRSLILRDLHRHSGNTPDTAAEIPLSARQFRPTGETPMERREARAFDHRPRRDKDRDFRPPPRIEGDRPHGEGQTSPRPLSTVERGQDRPRGDGDRPYTPRPRTEGDRPYTPRPRTEGQTSPRNPLRDERGQDRPRREGGERSASDRPRREGERPYTPRPRTEGDRPYTPRPRPEGGERSASDRPRREGERPYTPRPRAEGDRPYTPRPPREDGERSASDRPRRDGDRPYTPRPRPEGGERSASDRPRHEGERPYTPRPRTEGDRSYTPRPTSTARGDARRPEGGERSASDRPRRDGERPYTPRPRTEGDRPYTPRPRPEGGERSASDRPRREGDRPYTPRPRTEGDRPYTPRPRTEGDRPYTPRPRPEGQERSASDRPRREGDRPYTPRPTSTARGDARRPEGGERSASDRPYTPRPAGDRYNKDGSRGDRPKSSRPRPSEGRQGGTMPYVPRRPDAAPRKPRYATGSEGSEGGDNQPEGGKPTINPGKPKQIPGGGKGPKPGGGRPPVQKGRSNKPPLQRKHGSK